MKSDIKLHYFDARGAASRGRDEFREISAGKHDETFDAAKEAGELDAGIGKVPILEVDGVKVGQSKAIARYVASKYGFAGASAIEAFKIDCLCEHVVDIKATYQKVKGDGDEAKAKYFGETLPGESSPRSRRASATRRAPGSSAASRAARTSSSWSS
ncbi:glutathione transferase [Aureococcus anophagefferens]|nr:glutathione transferase [Aureococcus anophagefferens]